MKPLDWCSVPVIVDDATNELFEMPTPDEDAEQQIAFRVTNSTVELVSKDFARYEPSLKRMVETWREEKERVMQDKKAQSQSPSPEQSDNTK